MDLQAETLELDRRERKETQRRFLYATFALLSVTVRAACANFPVTILSVSI
jgi:hypothetical protein